MDSLLDVGKLRKMVIMIDGKSFFSLRSLMMNKIQEIDINIRPILEKFMIDNWSAPKIVSRGKVYPSSTLEGYVILDDNRIKGLITYHIDGSQCEIVSLNSTVENQGIASALIDKVEEMVKAKKLTRLWLTTTNDNLRAIGFYQKRGFNLIKLHRDSVEEARKLKPEIPQLGNHNIPIKHELEFEKIFE